MAIAFAISRAIALARHLLLPRRLPGVVLLVIALLAITSCGDGSSNGAQSNPVELHVFNWEDYIAPDTLKNFEQETGIRVTLQVFENEDGMLAGLQSTPGYHDVIITSRAMLSVLVELKLLEPLVLEDIPNISNIEDRFLDQTFDPGNRFSVPYLWGTMGLAFNTSRVPADSDSWQVLWDPAYSGHIAMLGDPEEVLGAALKLMGYSSSSTEPGLLEQARAKALEQKPLLAGYLDPVTIVDGLINGELWAAQSYNGDALTAAAENPDVTYVLPREGGVHFYGQPGDPSRIHAQGGGAPVHKLHFEAGSRRCHIQLHLLRQYQFVSP